jgi:Asp/Glu/hydantoin racemase
MKRIAILHTTKVTIDILRRYTNDINELEFIDILDSSLLEDVMDSGINENIKKRMLLYIKAAEEAGAKALVSGCSSVGEVLEDCRSYCRIPLFRIDEAMAEKAVDKGKRIAVIGTVETTLKPTSELIKRKAEIAGKKIELSMHLCTEAFEAIRKGDSQTHDRYILDMIRRLSMDNDVIVLAQASMSRLKYDEYNTKVLTSPVLGIEKIKESVLGKR